MTHTMYYIMSLYMICYLFLESRIRTANGNVFVMYVKHKKNK